MPYSLEFQASAGDDFDRLDAAIARRVRNKLVELSGRAEAAPHEALTGPL